MQARADLCVVIGCQLKTFYKSFSLAFKKKNYNANTLKKCFLVYY